MYFTQSLLPLMIATLMLSPSGLHDVNGDTGSMWDTFKEKVNMIGKTIAGTACLTTVAAPIARCQDNYNQELELRREEPDAIAKCCAYNELSKCVANIAVRECGDDGHMVAKSLVNEMTRLATNQDCLNYGQIACLKTYEIMIVAVFLAMIVLSCVYCCWCLVKRRNRRDINPISDVYKSILAGNGSNGGLIGKY